MDGGLRGKNGQTQRTVKKDWANKKDCGETKTMDKLKQKYTPA